MVWLLRHQVTLKYGKFANKYLALVDRYLSASLICIYSSMTSGLPMVLSYNWLNNDTANKTIGKAKN